MPGLERFKQGEAERMEIMSTRSFSEPEVLVSGRRLGLSLLASICAAGGVGVVSYYGLNRTMGSALGSALPQIVTFAVYLALVAVLCYSFRPPSRPPIALYFTSVKDLVFAIGATVALIAACALAYAVLGLFFGGFLHLLEQLTAVATDAKRLQGQGSSPWVIAILRGCLLVPIFEEVFFRGLLLSWLNRHMPFAFALLVMAVLFAAMHVYPPALPYTFLFGIATGYVRRTTGSTVNTVLMHVINNIVLLTLGLHFFGH
jgi:membrane protease YdiL (CAAX protease family)